MGSSCSRRSWRTQLLKRDSNSKREVKSGGWRTRSVRSRKQGSRSQRWSWETYTGPSSWDSSKRIKPPCSRHRRRRPGSRKTPRYRRQRGFCCRRRMRSKCRPGRRQKKTPRDAAEFWPRHGRKTLKARRGWESPWAAMCCSSGRKRDRQEP